MRWGSRRFSIMYTFLVVGEEWSQRGGRMSGVVRIEFCHGEEGGPIGLLEVTVDIEVLFQD